ncbi:MAG: dynamin family protein [Crocosphaera sp.]
MSIDDKLRNIRILLREFHDHQSNLFKEFSEVSDNQSLNNKLTNLNTAYEEAKKRLTKPSLRVATFGTTSSGKSTIVNALIGRKIAPMNTKEMSGGILTLQHGGEPRLVIKNTPDAPWETGEWDQQEELNDIKLYDRIKQVMETYHKKRKQKDYIAPRITCTVPLLPACDRELSGLPEDPNRFC